MQVMTSAQTIVSLEALKRFYFQRDLGNKVLEMVESVGGELLEKLEQRRD